MNSSWQIAFCNLISKYLNSTPFFFRLVKSNHDLYRLSSSVTFHSHRQFYFSISITRSVHHTLSSIYLSLSRYHFLFLCLFYAVSVSDSYTLFASPSSHHLCHRKSCIILMNFPIFNCRYNGKHAQKPAASQKIHKLV